MHDTRRVRFGRICGLAFSAMAIFVVAFRAPAESPRSIQATRVAEPISVDGRFDEPAWQRATPIREFVQMIPNTGDPVSETTEVRILYDDRRLYFAFLCFDREMNKAIINEMRRDSPSIRSGDHAFVFLDPYNDRNSAAFFRFNALGGMEDTAVSDGGNALNESWDAVWECAGRVNDDHWTAEVAIPFSQLRFREAEPMTWGINFGRDITRKREISTWSPAPGGYGALGKYRPAYFGDLAGLTGIRAPKRLELLPYVSLGASRRGGKDDFVYDEGFDAKYGVTSNLTADLTFNTDFAQVEADQQQINLSRFSLFFPEKRPFFMEGAGQFEFGVPRFALDAPPSMLLFYSRRIGIAGDRAVPILGGAKVTGQAGPYGVGLINIFTDELDDASNPVPRTNTSVVRLTRNLPKASTVGVIAVNQQDSERRNSAFGANFALRPRGNLDLRGLWARTSDDLDAPGSRDTFYAGGDWKTTTLSANAAYTDIGEAFHPATGFVYRTGIRQLNAGFDYAPRPRRYGVRSVGVGPSTVAVWSREGGLVTRDANAHARVEFESNWSVDGRVRFVKDRVDKEFQLFGATIPAAEYDFVESGFSVNLPPSQTLSGGASVNFGEFYNGTRRSFGVKASARPTVRLGIEPSVDLNRVVLPNAEFDAAIVGSRVTYSFSPTLYARLFAQWTNDRDIAVANFLLNWIYRPGSDVYLVINQTYVTTSGVDVAETVVLAKVTFWWSR